MMHRRTFLAGCSGALLWPLLGRAESAESSSLPTGLLEESPFVYISPLRGDGSESTCHGEVWYGWIDGAVVINTAPSTWKARALAKGLDRARIWVGDHGRWKQLLGRNESFREAPSFEARVESVEDGEALLDRLLALYEKKYPDEVGDWSDKMREGYRSGARLLLRYTPVDG